jgi:hypothetical protein
MSGAIHPLPQYVFMVWCLVTAQGNFTFTFTLRFIFELPSYFTLVAADATFSILNVYANHYISGLM